VACHSGGLFGPEGTSYDYPGDLRGTPAYLATSDPDLFVPRARVEETAHLSLRMGAQVEFRVHREAGHVIVPDDV